METKTDSRKPSIFRTAVTELATSMQILAVLAVSILMAITISVILYQFTERVLISRLQERLVAIAATAATKFEAEEVIDIIGPDDVEKPGFEVLTDKLNEVRDANTQIQYAYLMRRTDDPDVVEFIADADSLAPLEEIDANEDGVLQEDEIAPQPGDPYEVADYPVLRNEAFDRPSVDRELQEDQWGLIMASYAPIKNADGETVAILGIDVLVDGFKERTQATLMPFVVFIIFLILLITVLTFVLMHFNARRVEAMREIDRQKDELLSIVSHQLATPVTSIKWNLEMLANGDIGELTKDQKKQVESTEAVTENMVDLVGMILDVSRIQLGRMKVDRGDIELDEFFNGVVEMIKPKAAEKKISFDVKVPKKLPTASFDRRLLRMTLENLLTNAIKYTPNKGKVTLKVEVKDNNLNYSVADTGCGIPKADQSQMFEKLFRASNVRDVKGNGLGLYAAKGAVEAQGGKISFVSKVNTGTTFNVTLPIVEPSK